MPYRVPGPDIDPTARELLYLANDPVAVEILVGQGCKGEERGLRIGLVIWTTIYLLNDIYQGASQIRPAGKQRWIQSKMA